MKKYIILVGFLLFAAPSVYADTIGQQQVFSVDSQYDIRGRSQITATMRGNSDRAYVYVADDYWNTLDETGRTQMTAVINDLTREFNNRIYPLETSFFGSDPSPGVDHDPHVTLVLTRLISSVGGYFDNAHSYSRQQISSSNERDMVFLNVSGTSRSERLFPFLSHEFQHLISFNQKEQLRSVVDDIWLNEARSEYAVTLLGYHMPFSNSILSHRMQTFLNQPTDSLTEWRNVLADYGQVALFAEYVAEHWPAKIIGDTSLTAAVGIPAVTEALARNGRSETFADVFQYWMAANFLNDRSQNPLFGYINPGLAASRVAPTQMLSNISSIPTSINISMKPWEQRWYDVQLPQAGGTYFHVTADAPANVHISYLLFFTDGTHSLQTDRDVHIPNVGSRVTRVVLMPYLQDVRAGFGSQENPIPVTLLLSRDDTPPIPIIPKNVSPDYFGLHEGDFIRADGNINVYIINQFGYKRIVLSPKICLLYAHLGKRGCFDSIRKVTPEVRDAFVTSPYYSNGYTKDGKVYKLIETGEDTAYLAPDTHALDNEVFFINDLEQRAYGQ